jgi:Cupin-like domain
MTCTTLEHRANQRGVDRDVQSVTDIDPERFQRDFLDKEPVVMRFRSAVFPALEQWTPQYLRDRFGERRSPTYENHAHATFSQGEDFTGEVTEVSLPVAQVVDEVFEHPDTAGRRLSLRIRFRDEGVLDLLGEDLRILPPLFSTPLDLQTSGVWLGHGGNRTPLHSDSWEGILGQVRGTKIVHAFPPSCAQELTRLERAIRTYPDPMTTLMDHWEQVRRIEHFRCAIGPGDVLYIPPSWFHDVESLDASVSLVFRF